MWIKTDMQQAVEKVARIFYVDYTMTASWNEGRRENEPRLMTGWCWEAKSGGRHQAGIKTITAAYIDCWYHLVAEVEPPRISRSRVRLTVVSDRKVA
jgi:hypothetical protein